LLYELQVIHYRKTLPYQTVNEYATYIKEHLMFKVTVENFMKNGALPYCDEWEEQESSKET